MQTHGLKEAVLFPELLSGHDGAAALLEEECGSQSPGHEPSCCPHSSEGGRSWDLQAMGGICGPAESLSDSLIQKKLASVCLSFHF